MNRESPTMDRTPIPDEPALGEKPWTLKFINSRLHVSFGDISEASPPIKNKVQTISNPATYEIDARIGRCEPAVTPQIFIRADASRQFLDTWEVVLAAWTNLLHKTALPEHGMPTAQPPLRSLL